MCGVCVCVWGGGGGGEREVVVFFVCFSAPTVPTFVYFLANLSRKFAYIFFKRVLYRLHKDDRVCSLI